MNKEDIIDYVMHTPQNTNYSVLNSILDQYGEGPELDTITLRVTVPPIPTSGYVYVRNTITETDGGRIMFDEKKCSPGTTTDCVVPCRRDKTTNNVKATAVMFDGIAVNVKLTIQSEWVKEKYSNAKENAMVASIHSGAPDIVEVTAIAAITNL